MEKEDLNLIASFSTKKDDVLWASKSSNTKALGSAISRELEKRDKLDVRAIGVSAVNQATKAISVAGGFLGQKGKSVTARIGFVDVTVPNRDKPISAINWRLKLE